MADLSFQNPDTISHIVEHGSQLLGQIPMRPDICVRIQAVPGKGRGVISENSIGAGTIILCDAVERYSGQSARALRSHPLYYHLFVDPSTYGRRASCDLLWAIGPISVINHSETPNCLVSWRKSSDREWALLSARQDIRPGEELLINYTNIDEYENRAMFA